MAEEIFDVVDEQDEVIYQAPRKDVHARGLLHRAVHVLVFNAQGQIFLQQRARTKDTFPSRWDSSAAGHVASGDGYDLTAQRELEEELGVTAPPEAFEPLFYIRACRETGNEFVWVYRTRHEGPFHLQASEIEGGGWFAPEHVDGWIAERPDDHAPSFVLIWQQWRQAATPGV
ncbi:MAG: NUDIX domain-containing protein [Verrucomicrobiota bacterium JB022]|nr:NUDIX domain-containing protein [Verrucomicrobiota bacterium JB022]